jgi:tetratricopeptide (TPR) repeat protein
VQQYRDGDRVEAVKQFLSWTTARLEALAKGERKLDEAAAEAGTPSPRRGPSTWIAAAVLLSTETLHEGGPYRPHFDLASLGIRRLSHDRNASVFCRDWTTIMASWLLASGRLEEARRLAETVEPDGDGLLLRASVADGIALRPPPAKTEASAAGRRRWDRPGLLREAEQRYRLALSLDPTLVEAKVRLAWLLTHDGRVDEARPLLAAAHQDSQDGYLTYLAALFLGRGCERQGRVDEARAWYEKASRVYPEGQTAYVALGHLLEAGGSPRDGWFRVLDMFGKGPGPQRDPWWVYLDAQFWQADRRMARMRAYAREGR